MSLTTSQIKELNARFSDGIFFEGLVIVRDPDANPIVTDYFANYPDSFELDGNTYVPLAMVFPDQKADGSMSLPVASVNLSNAGNQVIDYIEDESNQVVIAHNDVIMQVIHRDRLGNVDIYSEVAMQASFVVDFGEIVSLHVGLNIRLEDDLPTDTIEVSEFPGLRADVIR